MSADNLRLLQQVIMRSSRSSLHDSRRPLQTAQITQSGLNVEFNLLQEKDKHYIEFEIKYLGDVPNVSMATDTTNRTEVLKIIDRGKKQGLIPLHVGYEHDAILYLSKFCIKVNRRDGKEDLLLELPLHKISQLSYVKEDGLHILCIKFGTPEKLNLAVCHCDSQQTAEAICSLVNHCFHLVYTDVMIDLIEDTIDVAISDNHSCNSDIDPQFMSPSIVGGSTGPNSPGKLPTRSEISNESSQAELLRDYMWQLNVKLRPDELKKFSVLLKNWNYSANRLQEFCEQLYELYGPERKYLLTGMFPFIPERDGEIFANFLKSHDISLPGQGTLSSLQGYPPQFYTRSISGNSIHSYTAITSDLDTIANTDDFDELDAMGKRLENIELSVGEPTQSYLGNSLEKSNKL